MPGPPPARRRLARLAAALRPADPAASPSLRPAATAADDEASVELTLASGGDSVDITVGGEAFATYCFAESLSRPFLWPVRGPHGQVITRAHQPDDGATPPHPPQPACHLPPATPAARPSKITPVSGRAGEHPHQKGIYVAQDEVNGVRFWGERQIPDNVENWPQGKIESRDVSLAVAAGDPAVLAYQSDWLGAGGTPILNESTTVQVHGNRLLEYTVTLRAAESDVIINDTKEGFCARRRCFLVRLVPSCEREHSKGVAVAVGIRMVDELREVEGATVVSSGEPPDPTLLTVHLGKSTSVRSDENENPERSGGWAAEGDVGCDACYGKHAAWIDYSGPLVAPHPHHHHHTHTLLAGKRAYSDAWHHAGDRSQGARPAGIAHGSERDG